MPWEPTILEQFQSVDPYATDEGEYYGPYITLLTDLFHHTNLYQVSPRPVLATPTGSIDLTVTCRDITTMRKVPVLFVDINPHVHLYDFAKREKADNRIRDRFRELLSKSYPDLPRRLYGISAMGTCFAVYEYAKETNRITPPSIPRDADILNDVAPQARWEYELLGADGEEKLISIVNAITGL